jgi:hypothetical protein
MIACDGSQDGVELGCNARPFRCWVDWMMNTMMTVTIVVLISS